MNIKQTSIRDITPYEKNPRKNDNAVKYVANSIREFGFKQPIVVDKNGVIIAGHTRYKAAISLGLFEVPVLYATDLSEEQVKAYRLADNKTGEFATWDMDLLELELNELSEIDFDMDPFGYEDWSEDAEEDDFDVSKALEEVLEPVTKRGDIWKLDRHRLMCGDSTVRSNIAMLMNGNQADLVLTDPPYNVDYEGATKEKLKIQNDNMNDNAFLQFLTDAFSGMHEYSKKGAAIYVFHADSKGYNFRTAFKKAGYQLRQCLIWAKNSMVMGRQDYQWQHEPILYGWKEGSSHRWYGDRKQTTLIRYDKPLSNAEHPTMKPIGLCSYLLLNSSKEGNIILDPFGGSGSTLIACEQKERTCYTIELDERYCDVIIKRWEQYTNKKAELLYEGQKAIPVCDHGR